MKTKDFNHIYDCILTAIADDFEDDEAMKDAASVIFTRLLTGSAEEKQEIIDEYGLECCGICDHCGELMTEGWLLDATTMCSDECAAWFFSETVEQFRHRMSDENFIRQAMEWDHCQKAYEELTEEERRRYLDDAMNATAYYWTEWE